MNAEDKGESTVRETNIDEDAAINEKSATKYDGKDVTKALPSNQSAAKTDEEKAKAAQSSVANDMDICSDVGDGEKATGELRAAKKASDDVALNQKAGGEVAKEGDNVNTKPTEDTKTQSSNQSGVAKDDEAAEVEEEVPSSLPSTSGIAATLGRAIVAVTKAMSPFGREKVEAEHPYTDETFAFQAVNDNGEDKRKSGKAADVASTEATKQVSHKVGGVPTTKNDEEDTSSSSDSDDDSTYGNEANDSAKKVPKQSETVAKGSPKANEAMKDESESSSDSSSSDSSSDDESDDDGDDGNGAEDVGKKLVRKETATADDDPVLAKDNLSLIHI